MAVPGAGEISLGKIAKEFVYDNYDSTSTQPGNVSLQTLSTHTGDDSIDAVNLESPNHPDGNASHGMFEFFAYDHNYVPVPCNKSMDVVFVLDYTGSMTDEFNDSEYGIKNIITNITNKIVERSGGDYRIGLVLVDQNIYNNNPDYWGNNTVAANLASQYRYAPPNVSGGADKVRLTSLVQMSSDNRSTIHSRVGMLASTTNDANNMTLGQGDGVAEPMDLAIDRVINHDFAGAFRSNVNKMIILLTDNAPTGDGDDTFDGAEEYDKMGTLTTTAVAEKIVISVCGNISDSGTFPKSVHGIYQAYADNTGGSFDASSDPTDIITFIENICNDIETNFATVVTSAESSITTSGFTMNGNITAQGGSSVTARGFVRSTSNISLFIGGSGVTNTTSGSGTGTFSTSVTGLSSGTTYYYKAYATNSTGTAYGDIEPVTTSSGPSLTSFTSAQAETGLESCSQTLNQTYYHDGSGARPVANDKVYTDSAGNNVLSSGIYRLDNNTRFTIFGNAGVVVSIDNCS